MSAHHLTAEQRFAELKGDERFFVSGPVVSYRPNSFNVAKLAPAPQATPKPAFSEGDGGSVGADLQTDPVKRAVARKAANPDECAHRWTRISAWTPKFDLPRCRARCAVCKREKILNERDVPRSYTARSWRKDRV